MANKTFEILERKFMGRKDFKVLGWRQLGKLIINYGIIYKMKTFLKSIVLLALVFLPSTSFGAFSVGWNATSTDIGSIQPNAVNGNIFFVKVPYITATSTSKASTFPYASSTAFTVSGNSYLGTISSGLWNGTAIDISSFTNLAVTYPIVLTGDTLSSALSTTTANIWSNTNTFSSALFNLTGLTNGCLEIGSNLITSTGAACGSGGGGSGGTWSTTTSSVAGQFINYPNNNDDIVTVGGNSTSTAKFILDPNSTDVALGIGTSSPYATLSVVGQAVASHFTATTSTASNFPYASTTMVTATLASSTRFVAGAGTSALPSFYFSGDPDTGFYQSAANTLGFSAGGSSLGTWSSSILNPQTDLTGGVIGVTNSYKLEVDNSALSVPTYSFSNDSNTGIYNVSADVLGIGTGGVASAMFGVGTSTILGNLNITGNSTSTNATSTNFSVSNSISAPFLTSAILLADGSGQFGEYTGTSCTNQFVRSLSALGVATCATVANTDLANSTISGISLGSNLANLTTTDGTLTLSGTYNGSTARTIGLTLSNANTWTALQSFANASTTMLSSSDTYLYSSLRIPTSTDPSVEAVGKVAINTTQASTSLRYHDGTAERALYPDTDKTFVIASSTLPAYKGLGATSTISWGLTLHAETWNEIGCFASTTGTGGLRFGDDSGNYMNYVPISSTANIVTMSSNNSFIRGEKKYLQIRAETSLTSDITCTVNVRRNAD